MVKRLLPSYLLPSSMFLYFVSEITYMLKQYLYQSLNNIDRLISETFHRLKRQNLRVLFLSQDATWHGDPIYHIQLVRDRNWFQADTQNYYIRML